MLTTINTNIQYNGESYITEDHMEDSEPYFYSAIIAYMKAEYNNGETEFSFDIEKDNFKDKYESILNEDYEAFKKDASAFINKIIK